MDKYFNYHVALTSFFGGVCCYVLSLFLVDSYLAAHIALLFSLMLLIVLPVILFLRERKYRGFESTFEGITSLRVNATSHIGNRVRNGYLYALADMLCYVCFDQRPYIVIKLPYVQIHNAALLQRSKMRITCNDGRMLDFMAQDIEIMFRHLQASALVHALN
jgi:hypothetical protein